MKWGKYISKIPLKNICNVDRFIYIISKIYMKEEDIAMRCVAMIINDDNLVVELKKKNTLALEYLIHRYGGLIKSVVKKTLFKEEYMSEVEECISDVVLSIWNNIDSFNQSRPLANWIGAIAKYKAIDYGRRLSEKPNCHDICELEIKSLNNIEEKILQEENFKEILTIVTMLKPEDREIFIRKYVDGESSKEIGKSFGVKEWVINNRLSRGKKKIREVILKEGERGI